MQEVWAGWAFPPFSSFLYNVQEYKNVFSPQNMEVSDHVFSACVWLNILQNLCCLFFSSPPLPVLPLTPACLSFPSGRFLMSAGRLWRALPQMQNISLNLFSSLYPPFVLVPTFFFQQTYLLSCHGKESLPWCHHFHRYSMLGGTHMDHQLQLFSGARTQIPPYQHCSAPPWKDWTLFWSFPHSYFDFPPILDFYHHFPGHFSKLSSSDLFFSTVLSLLDLLLFKLYTVMFDTIIDNKIAPEPFSTVLVLFFFFFLEHDLKMTNTSWFVSEKWNSSPLEGGSTFTASSLAKKRSHDL